MRFTYAESMIEPTQYFPLAIAAEQAGYTSFTIPDSLCYPKASDTKYPYTDTGDREFLENAPFIEPFILIASLGAVTETLRFTTFVMKLPIRYPTLVAKSATSVAVLTNNRFGFGVGLSPWPEDFMATGTDWKTRGKRLDEMIEILRGLETGEYFEYHGTHYDFDALKLNPAPTKPIPILIGGHAEPALRRAARLGDGWMHAGGDPELLKKYLTRIQELRTEYGREKEDFEIHVISMDAFTADGIKRLEDLGVTDVIVGFRNAYSGVDDQSLEQKLTALRGFADNVIAKV